MNQASDNSPNSIVPGNKTWIKILFATTKEESHNQLKIILRKIMKYFKEKEFNQAMI